MSAVYFFFQKKFKTLTGGTGYVNTTSATRQRHAAARQRHAVSTRAPRRHHVGAVVSGLPAVAGGERRRPSKRGWARSREEAEGNQPTAAPLANGRRSKLHGEPERRRPRVNGGEANPRGRERKEGTGRLTVMRGARWRGRRGRRSDGGGGIDGEVRSQRGGRRRRSP